MRKRTRKKMGKWKKDSLKNLISMKLVMGSNFVNAFYFLQLYNDVFR